MSVAKNDGFHRSLLHCQHHFHIHVRVGPQPQLLKTRQAAECRLPIDVERLPLESKMFQVLQRAETWHLQHYMFDDALGGDALGNNSYMLCVVSTQ